ncbi:uncharacterized protein MYCFIDRAFT_171947 [Pseudocercospora fijiensis CIRAD86]|uniref:Uncharacterized protein n=1 Tax=Pseudocercospora fijiensis (strain CIRAD86) TaxID=383855 RepID=M3A4U4_PSEFD|nr:uncharacterized protein MYCFIDRAFT_171947 [Pseudocercospora fijiensis CIRAD86]EME86144.1 hypothetical protein MYCFIDRAFT_171947 [Pseudocercospora fijiensis CIRAD86]
MITGLWRPVTPYSVPDSLTIRLPTLQFSYPVSRFGCTATRLEARAEIGLFSSTASKLHLKLVPKGIFGDRCSPGAQGWMSILEVYPSASFITTTSRVNKNTMRSILTFAATIALAVSNLAKPKELRDVCNFHQAQPCLGAHFNYSYKKQKYYRSTDQHKPSDVCK